MRLNVTLYPQSLSCSVLLLSKNTHIKVQTHKLQVCPFLHTCETLITVLKQRM